MDLTLAKLIMTCLVCEFIVLAASIPLKDTVYEGFAAKIKRSSPFDNFSPFGIGKKYSNVALNPVSTIQQSINSFGNLFTPVRSSQRENVENFSKKSYSQVSTGKDAQTTSSDSSIHFPLRQDVRQQENVKKENIEDPKKSPNASKSEVNRIKEKMDSVVVDKEIIDAIFKDINRNDIDGVTTTEDTATDYTTETGDYESTTTDELLRIPAAAVASLLG